MAYSRHFPGFKASSILILLVLSGGWQGCFFQSEDSAVKATQSLEGYSWNKSPAITPRAPDGGEIVTLSSAADPSGKIHLVYVEGTDQAVKVFDLAADATVNSPFPTINLQWVSGYDDPILKFTQDGRPMIAATVSYRDLFLVYTGAGWDQWGQETIQDNLPSLLAWAPMADGGIVTAVDTTYLEGNRGHFRIYRIDAAGSRQLGSDIPTSGRVLHENILEDASGRIFFVFVDLVSDLTQAYMYHQGVWTDISRGLEGIRTWSHNLQQGPDGSIYLSFGELTPKHELSVFKWSGSEWKPVGQRRFATQSWHNTLFFKGDTLLMAYVEKVKWKSLHAYHFNGQKWSFVDSVSIDNQFADHSNIFPVDGSQHPSFFSLEARDRGALVQYTLEKNP